MEEEVPQFSVSVSPRRSERESFSEEASGIAQRALGQASMLHAPEPAPPSSGGGGAILPGRGSSSLRKSRSLSSRSLCRNETPTVAWQLGYSDDTTTAGEQLLVLDIDPRDPAYYASPSRRFGGAGRRQNVATAARTANITPAHKPPSVRTLSDGIKYCKLEQGYSTNIRKDGRSYHLGMFPGQEGDPTAIRLAQKKSVSYFLRMRTTAISIFRGQVF
jgi:hypothetical protein